VALATNQKNGLSSRDDLAYLNGDGAACGHRLFDTCVENRLVQGR
jgi:hypothetical protein